MAVWAMYRVVCDGNGDGHGCHESTEDKCTRGQARALAAALGFERIGRKDYCRACAAAVRQGRKDARAARKGR